MREKELRLEMKERKYKQFKMNKSILMENLKILSSKIKTEIDYTGKFYQRLSQNNQAVSIVSAGGTRNSNVR